MQKLGTLGGQEQPGTWTFILLVMAVPFVYSRSRCHKKRSLLLLPTKTGTTQWSQLLCSSDQCPIIEKMINVNLDLKFEVLHSFVPAVV